MNCHGYSALRMRVASVTVQLNLSNGLRSLASISLTAPLLGLCATSIATIESFRGTDPSSPVSLLIPYSYRFAHAFLPTLVGLFVGIIAKCGLGYCTSRLAGFAIELENGMSELLVQSRAGNNRPC